jgi:hypothetical protein
LECILFELSTQIKRLKIQNHSESWMKFRNWYCLVVYEIMQFFYQIFWRNESQMLEK